ncbi:MAG: GNAT family N-acetyltransferase, partial [Nitrososphaera sp.]
NTFSWGDYIDQVWDLWFQDRHGRMLVADSSGLQVGMAHVAACADSQSVWLEGVRVHPSYRRSKIATWLIEEMVKYGIEKGATQAYAIVARDNVASQRMMERTGFKVISEWSYYSTSEKLAKEPSSARLASPGDLDAVMQYLETSKIYVQSAKKYVRSWHWYTLDRVMLQELVSEGRVVLSGKPLAGISVINKKGYWNKKNILQVVYLDSHDASTLSDLLRFVTNLYLDGKYERLHLLCQHDKQMVSIIERFQIKESDQFLLYSKVFSG